MRPSLRQLFVARYMMPVACISLQPALASSQPALALGQPASPPAAQSKSGPAVPPAPPKNPARLTPMYLDKKLFTPDTWWRYEGGEEEIPSSFSVEQEGNVSVGGRLVVNRGAVVRYRVLTLPTPARAHVELLRRTRIRAPGAGERRVIRPIHWGDEGIEIVDTLFTAKRTPREFERQRYSRFGRYLVSLTGRSDLRAMGPRPERGERRWMSEPVFDRVARALLARWGHYKMLLATTKKA